MSCRPNPLPLAYRLWTNLIRLPAFAMVTIFFGSLSLLLSFIDKSGRMQHRISRVWARVVVFITGCSVTIHGRENLLKYPVAVYACNHTSYMDTPVIFSSLPFQFRILAKKELW